MHCVFGGSYFAIKDNGIHSWGQYGPIVGGTRCSARGRQSTIKMCDQNLNCLSKYWYLWAYILSRVSPTPLNTTGGPPSIIFAPHLLQQWRQQVYRPWSLPCQPLVHHLAHRHIFIPLAFPKESALTLSNWRCCFFHCTEKPWRL